MNENASSNITQILTSFQNFVMIYENPFWVKNASVEEVKTTFKLGNFIEKTTLKFKEAEYLGTFLKLLDVWNNQKNLKTYSQEFYELANDQILEKLFKYPDIKETTLDIGVRIYTSIYPKAKFEKFLQKLILTSSSLAAIADFVNNSLSDSVNIENRIILNKWADCFTHGQVDALKSEIESYLSLYKVEMMLPRILSILSSRNLPESEKGVQELILKCLLEKMLDRSLLSKTFWLAVLQSANKNDLAEVCTVYPAFLESLLNFVEYIGTMMNKNYDSDLPEWTSDPFLCFCPEITYFDIIKVLQTMCNDGCVKEYVLDRLDKAKEHSNATLWSELKNDIIKSELI